jgi:hypothetical protein
VVTSNFFVLLSVAANTTGATLDRKGPCRTVNYQVSAPGTVTASTVAIQASTDGSTWAQVGGVTNASSAVGTLKLPAPGYRYWRGVLSSYSGSGTVRVTAEVSA